MKLARDSAIVVLASFTLSGLLIFGINGFYDSFDAQNIKRFDGVDTSLFLKNEEGEPLFLPTKKGQINLNIASTFNEEERFLIEKGIRELDFVAKGLEYNYQSQSGNYISILPFDDVDKAQGDASYTMGRATIHHNRNCMEITYPIKITLNQELLQQYPSEAYSLVVKHELLHTLGFKDLYDKEDAQQLMYYAVTGNDMSEKEIETLNKVYAANYTGLVTTIKPNSLLYIPQEEEEVLEN